jgi:hypothetical protein
VVFRLDHAVDAERLLAEETVREVMSDYPGKAPELPVPPVNGNRVTVMARSDEYGPAYITFDGTPAGDLEVVDVAAKGYDLTAREAVRYWFCDRLAEHGREPVLNERITDNEQARGTWQPDQSRHLVLAMRNRLGDRPAELGRSVPKSASAEPRGPGRDDQGQAPRHRGGGPGNRRSGPVER